MYVQPWKRDRDRTQKITNQIPQSTMKYQIQRPMQSPKRYGQTCNDTHRYIGEVSRALIEEGTAARVASVRNCSPQGADESTRLDASDPDTGHGCERTVGVGRGVDGAGMIRLKGLRTSNSPGMPASTAFAALFAQRAVSVLVFPSDNTETEESLHMYRIPGSAARVQT